MTKYLDWDWYNFHLIPSIRIAKVKTEWLHKYEFKGWTILEFHWLFLTAGIQIENK